MWWGWCWCFGSAANPAPALGRMSRTGTRNPVGRFFSFESWDSDRCVFAMQMGSLSRPHFVKASIFCSATRS